MGKPEEKRIIPCLDVKDGRVVKGVKFVDFRDAGDPVEMAQYYEAEGADELVFLDISASVEGRRTMTDVVKKIAASISIPFAVGGGISSVDDMARIFDAGADKVGINTAAVVTPELIHLGAERFGSQRIVLAMDAKWNESWKDWEVYMHGGMKETGIHALAWTREVVERGAGEILLTSIDADGTKDGFDIELTREVSNAGGIPVIASGGAGTSEHFYEVFTEGKAAAGLAATIFHFQELTIKQLKEALRTKGVAVK